VIRHIVMWRLAAEDESQRDADAEVIRAELEGLVGVVPGLLSLTVRRNEVSGEHQYDVVLEAAYDTFADLDAYQVHPAHQAAAAQVRSRVSARAAVDYEV
jgi:hypothetical protein